VLIADTLLLERERAREREILDLEREIAPVIALPLKDVVSKLIECTARKMRKSNDSSEPRKERFIKVACEGVRQERSGKA